MRLKETDKSVEAMRVQLSRSDRIVYWVNFLSLFIVLSLMGLVSFESAIQNPDYLFLGLFTVVLIILFLSYKIVNLRLDVYKSDLSKEQFMEANKAVSKLNGWILISNKEHYFSAIKDCLWQWEGIRITVIRKKDRIYINNMVNPVLNSNPFTFGLNKKNKEELYSYVPIKP